MGSERLDVAGDPNRGRVGNTILDRVSLSDTLRRRANGPSSPQQHNRVPASGYLSNLPSLYAGLLVAVPVIIELECHWRRHREGTRRTRERLLRLPLRQYAAR